MIRRENERLRHENTRTINLYNQKLKNSKIFELKRDFKSSSNLTSNYIKI